MTRAAFEPTNRGAITDRAAVAVSAHSATLPAEA